MQTLGQKIRLFRERMGISQLDLELEIDVSVGSISRMENDKVNPTKETLLLIANALKLTGDEKTVLLGIYPIFATPNEVSSALLETESLIKDHERLLYVIDHFVNVFALSVGFLDLLKVPTNAIQELSGKNFYELIFDPRLNISSVVEPESFMSQIVTELARTRSETKFETHYQDLVQRLQENPVFKSAWELSTHISPENINSASKLVLLNINGSLKPFYFVREKLKTVPRFEFIEYLPANLGK